MMNTRQASKSIKKRLRRECKCSLHSPNDSRTHDVKTGRKCPKRFIDRLIEKGYFTSKRRFICQECLDRYGSDVHNAGLSYGGTSPPKYDLNITNHAEMPQSPLSLVSIDNEANETNSGINPEHIDEFMAKLDTLIASDVTTLHQKRPCKDPNEVLLYNLNTWIRDRPKELVSHLQKICNLDNSPASQYQLARLIEQIYKSQNSRLVLPLAFREGLITYKMSNSSLLSALNSKSKPSGSHTFITSWSNKSAECPIDFPPGVVSEQSSTMNKISRQSYSVLRTVKCHFE